MLPRKYPLAKLTSWFGIVALSLATQLASAAIIHSVDFEDIVSPGADVFPNVTPNEWLGFGNTPNGGTITQGSARDSGNVFGSINVVGAGDGWHAGQLLLFTGPMTQLSLHELQLTADLRSDHANVSRPGEFRIESLEKSGDTDEPWDITGGLEFNPQLSKSFSSVGGKLSDATALPIGGLFLDATAFQIVFAFNDIGVGSGSNSLHFDNLVFARVPAAPEPSVLALLGAGFLNVLARRRRG